MIFSIHVHYACLFQLFHHPAGNDAAASSVLLGQQYEMAMRIMIDMDMVLFKHHICMIPPVGMNASMMLKEKKK